MDPMYHEKGNAVTTNPQAGATYLRTTAVPLDQLTPFPGNAKRGDIAAIRASLRRNGQYRSLIVREIEHGPLTVLAGNHTMQALAHHGPGDCGRTVPTLNGNKPCGVCRNDPTWQLTARCEVITCNDDDARRINLTDNRSADLGTYDNDALAELLSTLDGDYHGTGYTDSDVQALITPPSEDWEDAFDNLPDGDQQYAARTFSLSVEQAEIIDRAIDTAAERADETDGNRNGAALTTICDAYNRNHI